MNTDKLYGMPAADPDALRQAMYSVVVKLQDQPQVQLQGTAMCLLAMCKALNVDVRRLLVSTERMSNDIDSPFSSHFRALEAYAREQMRRTG